MDLSRPSNQCILLSLYTSIHVYITHLDMHSEYGCMTYACENMEIHGSLAYLHV